MSVDQVYGVAVVLVAVGVVLFAVGLRHLLRWRFLDRHFRLYITLEPASASLASSSPDEPDEPDQSVRSAQPGLAGKRASSSLGQALQRHLLRTSYGAMVKGRLTRAGMTRKVWEVVVVQVGLGLVLAIAGLVLGPRALLAQVLIVTICGAAGVVLPLLWLGRRAGARLEAFEMQLPEAIDAMASTLQAGSSLQQAMAILAREMPPPISVEFLRVLREAELGLSFPDSLIELSKRLPSADLVIFTRAVSIQQRVGGNLASIFRVISHTIRERLRIRGETKVLTSQGRYSSYVVGGLPVALFVFMWFTNYQYLSGLFQPGIPRIIFGAGIGGMLVGFYGMNKIAAVEV